MIFELILIVAVIIFIGYFYIRNRHQYWINRGVPYLRPKNFFFGNAGEAFFGKVSLYEYHSEMYHEFSSSVKYGGYFNFLNPSLIVRDPELIKKILTKDFAYFMNRNSSAINEKDSLTLHLFNLSDERWRILRHKLTPVFTSGKIKYMFNLMKECSEELVQVIDELVDRNESFEIKDIMARFTTDVISSCAFGLQSNSLKNPESVFRIVSKKIFRVSFRSRIIGFIFVGFPGLRRILNLSSFDKDVKEFFETIVKNTIKFREEEHVQRNDFIDLLIGLKNETRNKDDDHKFELTENLIVGQCFVFFFAGFETSSGTLTFALLELAKNPHVQEKLFQEIICVFKEDCSEMTYESIHNMKYLDQVVSETLRLYPILPFLMRRCNEPYQIDENYTIEKGTRVIIPVLGLHRDPRYYENPREFNPERFTKEAKLERDHYTYLPFGEGPRSCIGMRFGLTQVKLGLAELIRRYEVSLAPKMENTLKFSKKSILVNVEGGVWLTFKKRISH